MSAALRILDANLNRAREGLRIMEDAARFALNDQALAAQVKALRHDLRAATDCLPSGVLEAHRDSAHDVGASITVGTELERRNLLEIVTASGKRLAEALRVIEELLKLDHPGASTHVKAMRYRAYDLDAQIQMRFGTGAFKQWKLCLILTDSLCKLPWRHVLRSVIEAGADCVQVREKGMESAVLLDRVREVIGLARPTGVSVIVNDRVDIALAGGADGVHVGQQDLSVKEIRKIAGRSLLVGVSTHDLAEAHAAVEAGADYCGVGAMFATNIKPDRQPSGLKYLREFVGRYPCMPHLAIGGVTGENIALLREAGAQGVAVSSAMCIADDPGEVARIILNELSTAKLSCFHDSARC